MNGAYRRRDVLAGAVAGAAVLAGCSGNDDGDAGGDGGDDGSNGSDVENEETTADSDGGNTETEQTQTAITTEQSDGPIYSGRYFENLRTNDAGNRVRFEIAGWPDAWAGGPAYGGDDRGPHPKDSRDAEGRLVVHIYDDASTVSNGEGRADLGSVAPGIHTEDEVLAYLADTGLFGGEPQVAFVDAPEDDDGEYIIRHDGPVRGEDLQAITDAGVTMAHIDPADYVSASSVNSPLFSANIYHKDGEAGRYDSLPAINIGFDMP